MKNESANSMPIFGHDLIGFFAACQSGSQDEDEPAINRLLIEQSVEQRGACIQSDDNLSMASLSAGCCGVN